MKRVCIYPKDVSLLTGKSLRHAQKILQDLKVALKKSKNQFITIEEFAIYSGIDKATVEKSCA
ncbi:hypothetical protein [Pedobacter cryotolerans]|uniref:Uncharacterized protein n=1 Tax=Pedobacter cryotolerans TaxID=2571270 RepID=A0A4U1C810_9SPHI|nr:hypothetical protein [Pedobacter cryotolerans]TKC01537.1 hypothetical protein FA045_09910 [Pedobacter cryotolerans]